MDPALLPFLETQPRVQLRECLPQPEQEAKQPSLLTLVKSVVGSDITGPVPMPVELHEPSTDLAKRAEDMEYTELLDEAAKLPTGSIQRLLKVAAYALSPYSGCHADRVGRPFYSLPGETLEAAYPEKGLRYLAEAIHDNGWLIAGHMEGRRWKLATNDQCKPRLGLSAMDFVPYWFLELTFDDGEVYTWTKAITTVNNIASGQLYISHRGTLDVKQDSTGRVAVIKFKAPTITTVSTKGRKIANRPVSGYLEENGKKLAAPILSGFWDSHLEAVYEDKSTQLLWKRIPLPDNDSRFQMTKFVLGLTDMPKEVEARLPPTDARHRHDVRLLAEGKLDKAREEKVRLEKRMFAMVSAHKTKGKICSIEPRWFVRSGGDIAPGEGICWRYSSQYWAARESGFQGEKLPDLFGNYSTEGDAL